MTLSSIAAAVLIFLVAAAPAAADTITLKNGDRISGTFQNVSGKTLNLQTESIGWLSIPLARIARVDLDAPVIVVVPYRTPKHGWLGMTLSGDWLLVLDDGYTAFVSASDVDVILPESHYRSIVTHAAGAWQDWTGNASLGFSVQRGTQENHTLSTTVDTRRERPRSVIFVPHLRTNVHLTMLLTNAAEAATTIGSNTLSGSVREDFLFSQGNFVFAIGQLDHVQNSGLQLRQTYGGGMGYDISRTGRGTFSVIGGLTFVRESYFTESANQPPGADQHTAQLLFGEKFSYQLTRRVHIDHTANAYPNLSIAGQFHADSNTSLALKLNARFSLTAELIDLYTNNPAPGGQRNNLALTTGLAVTF